MVEMPRTEIFKQATEIKEDNPVLQDHPGGRAEVRAAGPRRDRIKRGALVLALLAGTAIGGFYGYGYWTNGRFMESTDDAYVQADYTTVAPKVGGYIADVLVQDNEDVKAGQVLARIDDRDFRTALAQATADVNAAAATVHNLDAQVTLQNALVDQAKATLDATQASLTFAEQDAARYRDLMKTGSGTVQRAQQTEAIHAGAMAELQRDQAGLVAAQRKVAVLTTQREQSQAELAHSRALAQQAELNLSYTTIVAPMDGNVGARTLRVGQFVNAGTQLMAVVPLRAAYVVANFKETQLTYMRDGQPVDITVDSFPDVRVKGHVDSLSPASGLVFALLPPDNATGNFTKIVQRIPVKIALDDPGQAGLLRAGMSVEPTIDTKATVIAERERSGIARAIAAGTARPSTPAAIPAVDREAARSSTPAG
jgi:membrane fusion protein, multidrug efflux system